MSRKYFVFLFTSILIIASLVAYSMAIQLPHGPKNLYIATFFAVLLVTTGVKKQSDFSIAHLSASKMSLAAISGAISAASMPPINIPIIIFITIPTLYHFSMQLNRRNAFYFTWIFGAFYQMANMYWIYKPLLIAGGKFVLLIPLALLVIGIGSGFFTALSVLLVHHKSNPKIHSVLLFALSWTTMEYWRNVLFGGFPWGMIGYCWTDSLKMMQITSLVGIYGLSFITMMSAASIALVPKNLKKIYISVLLISAIFLYGHMRIATADIQYNDHIRLVLVGSNVEQKYKWHPENLVANFFKQINATKQALKDAAELYTEAQPIYNIVIWPENAVPYALSSTANSNFSNITALLPNNIDLLITGATRADKHLSWNSAFAIYDNGTKSMHYDKQKLVLLGEYTPPLLPIKKLLRNHRKLSFGTTDNSIMIPNVPTFGIAICYESLMPFELNNSSKPIKWLINLSNDAWFDGTIAPIKHFKISKMRAIERGVPLVRVANKGVSSVTDSYGRDVAQTIGSNSYYIISCLPKSITNATIFSRLIDGQQVSMIFAIIVTALTGIYFYKIIS